MRPESPKVLEDIRAAARYILDKTRGKILEEYLQDDLLRPAVAVLNRVLTPKKAGRKPKERSKRVWCSAIAADEVSRPESRHTAVVRGV